MDLSGRCPTLTFSVKDRVVRTNSRTTFSGGNCSDVDEDGKVKVRGEGQADGSVLATVVDVKG